MKVRFIVCRLIVIASRADCILGMKIGVSVYGIPTSTFLILRYLHSTAVSLSKLRPDRATPSSAGTHLSLTVPETSFTRATEQ